MTSLGLVLLLREKNEGLAIRSWVDFAIKTFADQFPDWTTVY